MSAQHDARMALLALYAEDAYDEARAKVGRPVSSVEPDPRLEPEWVVAGNIVGRDMLLTHGTLSSLADQRVWYGWLLHKKLDPTERVLVIRGTAGFLEWIIDAKFSFVRLKHGRAEAGFYGVYESLKLVADVPAPSSQKGFAYAVASRLMGGELTVVGHSLGAALATYAATEIAEIVGTRVSAVIVASPRPGDRKYGRYVERTVKSIASYRYATDIVPDLPLHVPFLYPYARLPSTRLLPNSIRVDETPTCSHHVLTYATQIDPSLRRAFIARPLDDAALGCIGVLPSSLT